MRMATGIVLLLWSVEDICCRSIRLWRLGAGMFLLILAGGIDGCLLTEAALWGMLPGVCLLAVSMTGKRSIGTADGAAVLTVGMLYGLWTGMEMLLYGLLLCCLPAAVLLAAGKIKKESRLPFLPFLLAGFLICCLSEPG